MKDLVSVIVPAYNVEKYIEKCIRSISEQTYKEIEIIVVNDGSSDGTCGILHSLQKEDCRIQIIDKDNEGVSAARNDGIKHSSGEFIIFVDGDDYLSNDYVDYMISLIKENNCEFCLSLNCYSQKNEKQSAGLEKKSILPNDAVALLLSPRVVVGCWNKIYSRSFLEKNNLLFSTDLFYGEGLNFIIQCAQKASKVGIGNKKVYYYRRNNNQSATTKFNIEKYRNGEKSLDIIKKNIILNGQKIEDMYLLHRSLFSLGAIVKIIENKCKKQYIEDYKRYKQYLRINLKSILRSKNVSFYRKCLLLSGLFFPSLVSKMDNCRRQKLQNDSIQ